MLPTLEKHGVLFVTDMEVLSLFSTVDSVDCQYVLPPSKLLACLILIQSYYVPAVLSPLSCPDISSGIAKAWRLALDPELKYAIENVDHLMKGMKRAGQMPAEGGEHALRALAEKIFPSMHVKRNRADQLGLPRSKNSSNVGKLQRPV